MRVLVACEFSGIVREAFKRRGHDAWSCDLLDTEIPGQHIKGDVMDLINNVANVNILDVRPTARRVRVVGATINLSRLNLIQLTILK